MMRYRVNWTGDGIVGAAVGTFYSNGTTDGDAEQFADSLAGFINQCVAEVGGGNLSGAVENEVDVINPATGLITSQHAVTPTAPAVATDTALSPKATQALISWNSSTFLGGRRVKGRTFIPCVKTAAVDANGNMGTAFANALASAATTFLSAVVEPVIYSRTNLQQVFITSASVPTKLAVLRSRRD